MNANHEKAQQALASATRLLKDLELDDADWAQQMKARPTDFNDLHSLEGLDAVAQQLRQAEVPTVDGTEGVVLKAFGANGDSGCGGDDGTKKPSQATQILSLLEKLNCEFFQADNRVFATIPAQGHFETWPIRRKSFKQWVAYQFYLASGKTPGSQALQDALTTIEGRAIHESTQQAVHLRIGGSEKEIFIDLCNDEWEMIHITAQGWNIVPHGSVKFVRGVGMLPLPIPQREGSLDLLKPFINVASDDDWRLFVGWLVNAIRPTGPQLGLQLDGEQGTGKTTLSEILKILIDPNMASKRSEPREIRDLMIAAKSNWLLAFDNLSALPMWLSDGLCRMSTGGAFGTRQLYSDEDEMIFEAKRPVIINGIGTVVTRPDLLDRYVILSLEQIPEAKRRPEIDFWGEFHSVAGLILGGLCDVISSAIVQRPSVRVAGLPRMADAVLWATAAESALGWESGSFNRAYAGNREGANSTALESSLLYEPLCKLLEEPNRTWRGTAGELLSALSEIIGESKAKQRAWPSSPRALRSDLQRIVPNLRSVGITVNFHKGRKGGSRHLDLERLGFQPPRPSTSSQSIVQMDGLDDLSGQIQGQSKSNQAENRLLDLERLGFQPPRPSTSSKSAPCLDGLDGLDGQKRGQSKSCLAGEALGPGGQKIDTNHQQQGAEYDDA